MCALGTIFICGQLLLTSVITTDFFLKRTKDFSSSCHIILVLFPSMTLIVSKTLAAPNPPPPPRHCQHQTFFSRKLVTDEDSGKDQNPQYLRRAMEGQRNLCLKLH